ncbi:MAG: MerR family transcriptional regulator [Nitrospiria bacterium]
MYAEKPYTPRDVCRRLNLSYRQLEYWVLIGVVNPVSEQHGMKIRRKFNDEDLLFLKAVKALTDEGFLVSRAAEKVRKEGIYLREKGRLEVE